MLGSRENERYFESHVEIFEWLRVSRDNVPGAILCRFTEAQARAFMLLHVFMHELGHHFDRIKLPSVVASEARITLSLSQEAAMTLE